MIYSYSDATTESRSDVVTDPLAILLEARFEPCQVCGEQSSGLHCGAITCEACKVRMKNQDFYHQKKLYLEILSSIN